MNREPVMNRTFATATGVAIAVALVLGGCSGGSGGSDSGGNGSRSDSAANQSDTAGSRDGAISGQPAPATRFEGDAYDSAAKPAAANPAAVSPAALSARRQVRNGDLRLRVKDVPAAAAKVRSLANNAKGFIADEKTSSDPTPVPVPQGQEDATISPPRPDRGQSVLTLRVPEVALDRVMDQVAELGKLTSRGQSSSDVTGQYVDTASRLRTQRESVDRVRALLSKATKLGEVVQIESELSRRQADLESLQAQLAALDDQTTLATLTVNLAPLQDTSATTPPQSAFVAGLADGWDALVKSVSVALTIVGAVLPFAVLTAAIALPLLALRRRRTVPSTPL